MEITSLTIRWQSWQTWFKTKKLANIPPPLPWGLINVYILIWMLLFFRVHGDHSTSNFASYFAYHFAHRFADHFASRFASHFINLQFWVILSTILLTILPNTFTLQCCTHFAALKLLGILSLFRYSFAFVSIFCLLISLVVGFRFVVLALKI